MNKAVFLYRNSIALSTPDDTSMTFPDETLDRNGFTRRMTVKGMAPFVAPGIAQEARTYFTR